MMKVKAIPTIWNPKPTAHAMAEVANTVAAVVTPCTPFVALKIKPAP
jgi:hypothetical protein